MALAFIGAGMVGVGSLVKFTSPPQATPPLDPLDACGGPNGTLDAASALAGADTLTANVPSGLADPAVDVVRCVATSSKAAFYSITTNGNSLYVGQQDGTVLRMDPATGAVVAQSRPGVDSAAILLYYLGSLYVGEDTAPKGLNAAPYHIYRLDPATLATLATFTVRSTYACGILVGQGGYLWSGGGGGDFIKHDPSTLVAVASGHYAEDNILFDGTNFWTQHFVKLYYVTPEMHILASDTSPVARPTGFFVLNGTSYFSDSSAAAMPGTTSHFYTLQASGPKIIFAVVGAIPFHLASPKTPLFYHGHLYLTTGTESPTTYLLILDAALSLVTNYTIEGTRGGGGGEASPTQTLLNGSIYFLSDSTIATITPP